MRWELESRASPPTCLLGEMGTTNLFYMLCFSGDAFGTSGPSMQSGITRVLELVLEMHFDELGADTKVNR